MSVELAIVATALGALLVGALAGHRRGYLTGLARGFRQGRERGPGLMEPATPPPPAPPDPPVGDGPFRTMSKPKRSERPPTHPARSPRSPVRDVVEALVDLPTLWHEVFCPETADVLCRQPVDEQAEILASFIMDPEAPGHIWRAASRMARKRWPELSDGVVTSDPRARELFAKLTGAYEAAGFTPVGHVRDALLNLGHYWRDVFSPDGYLVNIDVGVVNAREAREAFDRIKAERRSRIEDGVVCYREETGGDR